VCVHVWAGGLKKRKNSSPGVNQEK